MVIDIPAGHRVEYVDTIIAYEIVQDFDGVRFDIETDEQIFVPRVIVIAFVQQAVIYRRVESPIDVRLACPVLKGGGIELNHKIHTEHNGISYHCFFQSLRAVRGGVGRGGN